MKKYIVFFKKKGYLIYISSLDTVQVITRALRRAKIPFSHTEGFNPHPKLSFAPSLSLGFSSEEEFFEIELKEEWPKEEIKNKLNRELPKDLQIKRVEDGILNLFSGLSAHSFSVLSKKKENAPLKEKIYSIIKNEELKITKLNKKGRKSIYIVKEYLLNIKAIESDTCIILDMILNIKDGKSLNPKDIIQLLRNQGLALEPIRIKRTRFFIKEGKRLLKI